MIPKAELHCHLEGTAHPELVLVQAKKYGVPAQGYVDLKNGYLWTDFSSFLKAYDFVASLFRTPEDYINLTRDYFVRIANDGAIYCEIFISPDHAARIGCAYSTLVEAIAEGIKQANQQTGIEGRIIVVGVRHAGVGSVENAAPLAVQNPHPLVTAFGMAGDQTAARTKHFAKAFSIAKDAGLQLTSHAGEFCGPSSVSESLDHLKIERIGHGARAIEDTALVQRIVDEKIPLEICPASNVALRVYASIHGHPLKKLEQAGCLVTLNSDDPPHFQTSLKNEYEIAQKHFGYDDQALLGFTINAINAAFVDEKTRAQLLKKCIA